MRKVVGDRNSLSGYSKIDSVLELRQVFASHAFENKDSLILFLKTAVPDYVWKEFSVHLPTHIDRRKREDYADFLVQIGVLREK